MDLRFSYKVFSVIIFELCLKVIGEVLQLNPWITTLYHLMFDVWSDNITSLNRTKKNPIIHCWCWTTYGHFHINYRNWRRSENDPRYDQLIVTTSMENNLYFSSGNNIPTNCVFFSEFSYNSISPLKYLTTLFLPLKSRLHWMFLEPLRCRDKSRFLKSR